MTVAGTCLVFRPLLLADAAGGGPRSVPARCSAVALGGNSDEALTTTAPAGSSSGARRVGLDPASTACAAGSRHRPPSLEAQRGLASQGPGHLAWLQGIVFASFVVKLVQKETTRELRMRNVPASMRRASPGTACARALAAQVGGWAACGSPICSTSAPARRSCNPPSVCTALISIMHIGD